MSDEKLEFSMEDIGRFARFVDGRRDHLAFNLAFRWLSQFEDDRNKDRAIWDRLLTGYNEER